MIQYGLNLGYCFVCRHTLATLQLGDSGIDKRFGPSEVVFACRHQISDGDGLLKRREMPGRHLGFQPALLGKRKLNRHDAKLTQKEHYGTEPGWRQEAASH